MAGGGRGGGGGGRGGAAAEAAAEPEEEVAIDGGGGAAYLLFRPPPKGGRGWALRGAAGGRAALLPCPPSALMISTSNTPTRRTWSVEYAAASLVPILKFSLFFATKAPSDDLITVVLSTMQGTARGVSVEKRTPSNLEQPFPW